MANKRISQLPFVGNTGYTVNDIMPIVNYDVSSGTTKHTPLIDLQAYIVSGVTNGLITGGTYSGGTLVLSSPSGTINVTGFTTGSTQLYEVGTGFDSTQRVGVSADASGIGSIVAGGSGNTSTAAVSVVSGGGFNTSSGIGSIVSGGILNTSNNTGSTISGGFCNTSVGTLSTIGGGLRNTASGQFSIIGGGQCNTSSGYSSSIGGGFCNTSSGYYSNVSGGRQNTSSGCYSTVSGGYLNINKTRNSFIGGGSENKTEAVGASIVGGAINQAGLYGTISNVYNITYTGTLSGIYNNIQPTLTSSGLGSGARFNFYFDGTSTVEVEITEGGSDYQNGDLIIFSGSSFSPGGVDGIDNLTFQVNVSIFGDQSTIGGGFRNTTLNSSDVIGGGSNNIILNSGTVVGASTISGGYKNLSGNYYTFNGGGKNNTVLGEYSSIVGGEFNLINSGLVFLVSESSSNLGSITGTFTVNPITQTGYGSGLELVVGINSGSITGVTINNPGVRYEGGDLVKVFGTQLGSTNSNYIVFQIDKSINGNYSNIGGGVGNTVSNYYSNIGGGAKNTASGGYSTIGGGVGNIANGNLSGVSSGGGNKTITEYSYIGGGNKNYVGISGQVIKFNLIQPSVLPSLEIYSNVNTVINFSQDSTTGIGSGFIINVAFSLTGEITDVRLFDGGANYQVGDFITINGSTLGYISGGTAPGDILIEVTSVLDLTGGIVGGGIQNTALGSCTSVLGGFCNTANCGFSFVGGGCLNTAFSFNSTIAGGLQNTTSGGYATISGGYCNTSSGNYSTISGGQGNLVSSCLGTIGGGSFNKVNNILSTISGGYCNTIDCLSQCQFGATASFIGGGTFNRIKSCVCSCCSFGNTISGGYCNTTVSSYYDGKFIGGGVFNTSFCDFTTISGGYGNKTFDLGGTVGGGLFNTSNCDVSTTSGGYGNFSLVIGSTVGGGVLNSVGIPGTISSYSSYVYTPGTLSGYYGPFAPTCSLTGRGTGSSFYFQYNTGTLSGIYLNNPGVGYENGDKLFFSGSCFGGTSSDNLQFTINTTNFGNFSTVSGGYSNVIWGNCSGILGNCNFICNIGSFIVGNNISSQRDNTTYVNCLSIVNIETNPVGCPPGTVYTDGLGNLKIV